MTTGRITALTAGFVGAVALGVAIGPSITNRHADVALTPAPTVAVAPAVPDERPAPRARARSVDEPTAVASLPATEPTLHARLKPVLNRGTRMDMAAEGFRDAEQFATVAHAAHNTELPFMVLKHRTLNEGQTLTAAIRALKPDADATAEVRRARAEARADLADLANPDAVTQ